MKLFTTTTVLSTLPLLTFAQNVTVPTTCIAPYLAGTDTVLYTVPYPYASVLSIIGSYKNLTWSGSPDNTVTLNGTDNTVGTARTYDVLGAHIIETILTYSSPAGGPYYENHNTATFNITTGGVVVSTYIPNDATTVTSICGGRATSFNFTAQYCGLNVSTSGAVLHAAHLGDATEVGVLLGNMNFTTCDALGSATTTAPAAATYTGGVERVSVSGVGLGAVLVAALGVVVFV